MKIRKEHWLSDRVRLILILLSILLLMLKLAEFLQETEKALKIATIEGLLRIAMQPVGTTMYVWGGGWDEEDNASGATAMQIGISPEWKVFFSEQDKDYDFTKYRFEREKGLDCSGYVGWVIYNTFEHTSGREGYVVTSTNMAENFANRGWGELIKNPKEFLPGDIVSMEGHVWICLGTCKDGSVLLVHSSPPGVSVCGTPQRDSTRYGKEKESRAVELATEYMMKYHRIWQEKYPDRVVPLSYLEEVSIFRWNTKVMKDAKAIREKNAEEIIRLLSSGM